MTNEFLAKVFKKANVTAKVSKNPKDHRFRVVSGMLTLEGVVTATKYQMSITDKNGKTIDSIKVSVDNTNDVVNRINESINTLNMLSNVYDDKRLVEEDEEFDTVDPEEDYTDEPDNLVDGLDKLYNDILDVADSAEALTAVVDEEDAETLNNIIGITGSLYDVAIDVDEFKDDMLPDDEAEEMDESFSRKSSKRNGSNAVKSLAIVENLLRGDKNLSDILTAVRDIKSELIVRGY